MYPHKLRGDKIDPQFDFVGSVANRSSLSVYSKVPSIHHANINASQGRVFSNELFKNKVKRESVLYPKPEELNERTVPLPMPKKRGSKHKTGLLSKLGKRISTFGSIIEREHKPQKRSVSANDIATFNEFVHSNCIHPEPVEDKISIIEDMENLEIKGENEMEEQDKEKTVYTKNNQIFVNFSNNSASSFISEIINTYSQMDAQSIREFTMEECFRSPKISLPESIVKRQSTLSGSGSSKITEQDELFSKAPSSAFSRSSEELVETEGHNFNEYQPLVTKNYNKELPLTPSRRIDQFQIRDYSSNKNSVITDTSVPPRVPKHEILMKSQYPTPPETPYFDCRESFSDTPPSPKKKSIEIPTDTDVFTRKSKAYKGLIDRPLSKEKARISSSQYLQNVGISPFMLTGYQESSTLKVMNP